MFALVVVAACTSDPQPVDRREPVHPAPNHPSTNDDVAPLVPRDPIEPRMVLVDVPGETLGTWAVDIGDTSGDGLPELAVGRDGDTVVLSVVLADGTFQAAPFVVATLPRTERDVGPAGDTDHDGHGDVWFANLLFRGPLSGTYATEDADVEILGGEGQAVAGSFDADGDGELDVVLGGSQCFQIHYGPFPTDRAGWGHPDFDPSEATTVSGDAECAAEGVWVVGAMNEPEQVVVAAGTVTKAYGGANIAAFEVQGPRGRTLGSGDRVATFEDGRFFDPIPDLDGDGLDDLLYLWDPLPKPIAGWYDFPTKGLELDDVQGVHAVLDASGDALADIVVEHWPDGAPAPTWYLVPGTTRGTVDPAAIGVPLILPEGAFPFGVLSVDLDADGLAELIFRNMYFGEGGTLWVFDGTAIAASLAG